MPMTRTVVAIPRLSTEYLRVAVVAKKAGVTVSLTSSVVEMALVDSSPSARPITTDWFAASWEHDSALETYFAQGLIGPGGKDLVVGEYAVWLRITIDPEVVVRRVGTLVVE